jgi:putative flavoprotein involved in K+ transport
MTSVTETLDVVVVGGGQAGLDTSHELARTGIQHVVLERDRVGSSWAGLWESFQLNTPNWGLRLPGMAYDGDHPDGFMPRADVVAYLERYAAGQAGEVRTGIEVTMLRAADEGFLLETSVGPIEARAVVTCTGAYQRSFRPQGAQGLPEDLPAFDTRTYRSPESLPSGAVLVVGNGQSGCQIAEELCEAGRDVVISCGKASWAPRRTGGHDLLWWGLETGFLEGGVDTLPSPAARLAANVTASGTRGGHDLHVRTLRAQGARLAGHFTGCDGRRIRFAGDLGESVAWSDERYLDFARSVSELCAERNMVDPALPLPEPFDATGAVDSLDVADLGAVVFSGGFRPDYGWIRIADVCDEMGFPRQRDGASLVVPGLFFAGVHFLRKRKSSLLCGVGEDAAVVAEGVARHLAGAASGDGRGPMT